MLAKQHFLVLLFALASQANLPRNHSALKTPLKPLLNSYRTSDASKIGNASSTVENDKMSNSPARDASSSETILEEIKNEVPVNDLLEDIEESEATNTTEEYEGPNYDLNWAFIDKDTIRVTFDLFSLPTLAIENNKNSLLHKRKHNLVGTLAVMPSRTLKSITLLNYLRFIIRPYNKNREIILKLERLSLKNFTSRKHHHFSNSLRLTALNHHEKYSVCICYYQTNTSLKAPDLLLCQDVINDYAKFSHLKTDAKHGLVFITTQYSIIIALLVVLQSVFTIRKRRIAQIIAQMVSNKAHSIRSTLSSVSLVRQSFSSLDAAADQQHHHHHHHHHHHGNQHESTTKEGGLKKRIISSPAIVISEQSTSLDQGASSSEETEPFLKRIPSKNHVHFLLGTAEESDEEEGEPEDAHAHPPVSLSEREPYDGQSDALLSMAHILDTNKPWSRHTQQTTPV